MEGRTSQTANKVSSTLIELESQIVIQELTATKASKGDREALAQLCELIAKSVLFHMSRMLRNHVDAEDAAQEALIRVCKNIEQLKNPKTFRKWLGTIIVNEARRKMMQSVKQLNNVIHLSDIEEVAIDEDESFLPEQFAVNAESRKMVVEAIDRLPQRQKEAVLLHYYDRLNVTETAEAMGISQPAASIHLKEACARIKRYIEASEGKLTSAMQGFAAIPIGDMLARALFTEGSAFTPTSQTWMAETIARCGDIAMAGAVTVGGVAGAAGASKTVSGTSAASETTAIIASAVKTFLSVVAATVATLAITIGLIMWHPGQSTRSGIYATGGIIFTSENEKSHVNPTSAIATSESKYGELHVNHWEIISTDSETVLFSGDSSTVDESVFTAMRENGYFGNFELIFTMEDAYGARYELAHNFFLYE